MKKYTVLKLINGYDIICSYLPEKSAETYIEIIDPMTLVSTVSREGLSMVYLKRFNTLAEKDQMSIRKSQIISSYPPRKELIDYYLTILKYYKEEVDEEIARQLKTTTEMFQDSLKKAEEAAKKRINTTLDEMFEEYEKELMEEVKPKRKNVKVH